MASKAVAISRNRRNELDESLFSASPARVEILKTNKAIPARTKRINQIGISKSVAGAILFPCQTTGQENRELQHFGKFRVLRNRCTEFLGFLRNCARSRILLLMRQVSVTANAGILLYNYFSNRRMCELPAQMIGGRFRFSEDTRITSPL